MASFMPVADLTASESEFLDANKGMHIDVQITTEVRAWPGMALHAAVAQQLLSSPHSPQALVIFVRCPSGTAGIAPSSSQVFAGWQTCQVLCCI